MIIYIMGSEPIACLCLMQYISMVTKSLFFIFCDTLQGFESVYLIFLGKNDMKTRDLH